MKVNVSGQVGEKVKWIRDFRILALVCTLIGGMGQGVVAPKLPDLLPNSTALAWDSGLSAGLMYLGIFLTTFAFGRWADRGRVHWLLGPGLLGYAVTLLALGVAHLSWQVFAARFCEGICLSAIFVAADFVLGRLSAPAERGQWLSFYGVALSIGLLLGPALSLGLGHFVSPSVFLPLGTVAVIAVGLALWAFPRRIPPSADASPASTVRLNRAALSSGMAYGFMEAGLVAVFPILAVQEFHVAPEYCLITVILTAAGSSIFWGTLSDRIGPRKVMTGLLALLFAGPLLFCLADGKVPLAMTTYGSAALFGVLAGGLYPVGFAWLLQGLPESRYGFASGAFARAYGLGSLAGPLACGLASQFAHSAGMFGVIAGVGAIALLATRNNP